MLFRSKPSHGLLYAFIGFGVVALIGLGAFIYFQLSSPSIEADLVILSKKESGVGDRVRWEVVIENKAGALLISGLRLITGAMLAVFGPGMRSVMTGLVTAAIRGTGIYVEVMPDRTYFCTCYGNVGLTSKDGAKTEVVATNHSAHYVHAHASGGKSFVVAPLLNHDNRELAVLEKLAGRAPRLALPAQ